MAKKKFPFGLSELEVSRLQGVLDAGGVKPERLVREWVRWRG
jgi:hypothetical protein